MNKIPIIIDCDPGTDDAFAIFLAHASDKLDLRAITPVAGNVAYKFTSKNACDLAGYIGSDCRISRGADSAILKPFTGDAAYAHGQNGMAGIQIPNRTGRTQEDKYAWDVIYEEAVACKGELVIAAVGPLTNIAIAIMKHPDLKDYVKRILIMGGAFMEGNMTPYAEYNIWYDPHACELVLRSGIPITLCGLDCTMGAALTIDEIADIIGGESSIKEFCNGYVNFYSQPELERVENGAIDQSVREVITCAGQLNPVHKNSQLDFARDVRGRITIHDCITVAYLLDNTLFETRPEYVVCETRGVNAGQTVVDFRGHLKQAPNCDVAMRADREKFAAILRQMMDYYRNN